MRILVTGGAGFIGSHLVQNLLAAGREVTILDDFNDYYDPGLKRANAATFNGARIVEGDIRDGKAVERAFESRPDAVVHLAARAGVRPSLEQPDLYSSVNISGTFALLEACRRRGVPKFVFASSSSVYGDADRVPFREEWADTRPVSPYGVTKQAGEHAVRLYHRLHGLRTSALRFFTVYGPRQRPDMAIHKFARLILDEKEVPFFGDGTSRRDYTYVDDAVKGILGALGRDDGFEVYNIGESRTVGLGELIALLEKNLGKKARIKKLPDQPGDVKRTYADISKAKSNLGYAPDTTIEEGIRKFCEWVRSVDGKR
ncbi:MAG TPA: NAD-dependent epimerase/dehydratase family protein [Planctomycetota bacterium]|nr:NAD-dependent epimerase/dehydratase family protein [Planctomycetota bacterium]